MCGREEEEGKGDRGIDLLPLYSSEYMYTVQVYRPIACKVNLWKISSYAVAQHAAENILLWFGRIHPEFGQKIFIQWTDLRP